MCEASAFIRKKGEEEYALLLSGVDTVIPTEEGIMMESIFGEKKFIKAKINEMHLVDHKIFLEHL